MRLSSEIISVFLKKNFSFTIYGEIDSQLIYDRPVFWIPSEKTLDYSIYLCFLHDITAFPNALSHSLILTFKTQAETIPENCNIVFMFKDQTALLQAHNALNELYSIYEKWSLTLSKLLIQDSPIIELIDCSNNIFQNPILIHNRDFEFIAYSSFINKNSDLYFLVDQEHSQDAYSSYQFSRDFQHTFSQTGPAFFSADITGVKTLYMNIFSNDIFIARIVIPEVVRSLQESDKELLLYFSNYIQASITNQPLDDVDQKLFTLNHLIRMILENKLNEESYIENAMRTFHWQSDHDYFCVVFSLDALNIEKSTYKRISTRLRSLIQSSSIIEHTHKLVMFVNLSLGGHTPQNVISLCTEFARDNYLKIGCSRVYKGFHFGFQLLFKQAEIALLYGMRYIPQIWIHYFDDISDKYLLDKLVSDLPAKMVCLPEIVAMYHYDQEHQTEYLFTLKTYLEHNMQPVSTVNALFIHRTTLAYRLNKMQELFSISFSNAKERLFIQLSIMLLELTESKEVKEHQT